MTAHPSAESPSPRHYIRLDIDKSDEEREEGIFHWLVEVMGPPVDDQ